MINIYIIYVNYKLRLKCIFVRRRRVVYFREWGDYFVLWWFFRRYQVVEKFFSDKFLEFVKIRYCDYIFR